MSSAHDDLMPSLPRQPELPGSVIVEEQAEALYDALASTLMAAALDAVGSRGSFHLALSGGSTPKPFYVHLVIDPRYRFIPWDKTHVWLVDERQVPATDERNNGKMIREALTEHLPMPKRHFHAVPQDEPDPAAAYEAEMRELVGDDGILDFILLGMGDDAHTASLFPATPAQDEQARWVVTNDGPNVTPPDRVTLTYPMINRARRVAVLVTGSKKAETIATVEEQQRSGQPDIVRFPICGITPVGGQLTWYLDADAAGRD